MKVKAEFKNPNDMEVSLTITMLLKKWSDLKDAIIQHEADKTWPVWELTTAINSIIYQVEESFTVEQEEQIV